MLHIYYGMGKGKTSTLNGSAVRALGAGMKVGYFRFLKGRPSSEDKILENLGIKVRRFHGSEKFVIEMEPMEKLETRQNALIGLKFIVMNKKKFDVIIIDEILDLISHNVNFLTPTQLREFLEALKDKEVLISGHEKNEEIFRMADLITHFKPEKHYFEKGQKARKGIEF